MRAARSLTPGAASTSAASRPAARQRGQLPRARPPRAATSDVALGSSRLGDDGGDDETRRAATAASRASYSARVSLPAHGVAVRVERLRKEYPPPSPGAAPVVGARGFDLSLAANRLTALVGPSGSGKTTLLRLIAGLEAPSSGRILFDGDDVTAVPPRARRVGVVFQGYALFRHMSVADNIKFGPRMLGLPGDLNKRVADLLDLVELPHIARRLPGELSGGQRQRVALARALAAEPRVLLLDEPFSALDPDVRAALRAGLVDILRRAGVTAVMVSHDVDEAFAMADDVVVFHRGAPLAQGAPAALRADPGSPYVMELVHEANRLPAASLLPAAMGFRTAKPNVLVAPCDVGARAAPPPGGAPSVLGTVVDAYFAGDVRKYELRLADGTTLRADVATRGDDGATTDGGGVLLAVGGRVHVWAAPDRFMGYGDGDLDP